MCKLEIISYYTSHGVAYLSPAGGDRGGSEWSESSGYIHPQWPVWICARSALHTGHGWCRPRSPSWPKRFKIYGLQMTSMLESEVGGNVMVSCLLNSPPVNVRFDFL